ncbi:hypothetical protein M2160_008947 [Streptomyces sp. SAI-117]|nr:hypothetical protein [Streptomyces sp. SAI-117]
MRPRERHGELPVMPDGPIASAASEPSPREPSAEDAADGMDPNDIPQAVRDIARTAPGHWIGVVDPEWTEGRPPPEWALVGEWRSDDSGDLGEYRANPAYRPSARVLGWPDPTDPVDAAAQRAATGYGSVEDALTALAEADVAVLRAPDGEPLTAVGRDGAPVVLLFTSPAHEFMSSALRHDRLPTHELVRALDGSDALLLVNAAAAAPLFVPADSLPTPRGGPDTEASTTEVEQDHTGPSGTDSSPAAPDSGRTGDSPESSPHIARRTS